MTLAPTKPTVDTVELSDLVVTAEGVVRARGRAQEGRVQRMRPHGKRVQLWEFVDPLADQFPGYSPYTYTFNDPINLTDPTGMAPEGPPGGCCWGNPNVAFAKMALKVERTFGALVDRASVTLFGRYNTSTTTVGSGNASMTVESGVEASVTVRTNLESTLTYMDGATPSLDNVVTVEGSVKSRASVSAKVPVGAGNVGASATTTTSNGGETSTSRELNAGASVGGASGKVFAKETTSGGQTTTTAGAEVKVSTPSAWGQSFSGGARVEVRTDEPR